MKNQKLLTAVLLISSLFFFKPIFAQEMGEALPDQGLSPGQTVAGKTVELPKKISLDIKGMDVVDVLKLLSNRTGMNLVIGKNVSGRVTLFLKDVDAWDVMEIVLLSNDLAYYKKGNIINIMAQRDYELLYGEPFQDNKQAKIIALKYAKASDLSKALAQIKSNLGKIVVDEGTNTLVLMDTPQKLKAMADFIATTDTPLETRVFALNYAQSDKLLPKLQDAITKGVGSIRMDERTNKIIVTDYPAKLLTIAETITAFDEKTPQVLIDSQIIEISPSDLFEMGVDWNFWVTKYFQPQASLPGGTDVNRLFIGTTKTNPTGPDRYKAVLDILRTIGDTKILSSPRIMALNNQEAKIHVGTKDAYITSSSSQSSGAGSTVTAQSVNFVDTGIQLSVTPTISRDGFVTMKIKPEISTSKRESIISEGLSTDIPIVTTSEAETSVMVKDGVTIIIGGLKQDDREKTVKKIPFLGDIPWFGALFRSTSDSLTKKELVILLTPHIVTGEASFTDFSEIKPHSGAIMSMVNGEIVKEKIAPPQIKPASDYYLLLTNRIRQFAALDSPKGVKGVVELSFILSSKGELLGEPQVINSSDYSLTWFAVQAIKEACPFQPFPSGMSKERASFKICLTYQ